MTRSFEKKQARRANARRAPGAYADGIDNSITSPPKTVTRSTFETSKRRLHSHRFGDGIGALRQMPIKIHHSTRSARRSAPSGGQLRRHSAKVNRACDLVNSIRTG